MPRNDNAINAMANGNYPTRSVAMDNAAHLPGTPQGSFGLLWIPQFTATANSFVMGAANPPPWLLEGLT
jgi:hypothetical protein